MCLIRNSPGRYLDRTSQEPSSILTPESEVNSFSVSQLGTLYWVSLSELTDLSKSCLNHV